MTEWIWEARARTGEVRKGVMSAETADDVESRLRGQQLSPVKVKKKPREFQIKLQFGSGVSERDLVLFTRQFATMIDSGLPIVQCLEILQSQGENAAFNAVLKDIKGYVEQGGTLSEAMSRHPKVFDELFVNLIAAGEVGGILDTILGRLAGYIEKAATLKRQVRSAMVYPVSVLGIAFAIIFVMLTWVIPAFKSMFAEFGGSSELPAVTQFVINISEGFVGNIVFIVVGIAGGVTAVVYSYRTPRGKQFWHRLMLTAPIVGPVMRKIAVARFTRTLGTLLAAGVPILESMKIVAKAAGNVVVEDAILKTADKVSEGHTMVEPLAATNVFPPMVVQMIGVGEQTGALDAMLTKIADFYEDEVDAAVSGLTSLLEPLMMVVIGGIVGTIMIAMYMPIFDIAGKVKSE